MTSMRLHVHVSSRYNYLSHRRLLWSPFHLSDRPDALPSAEDLVFTHCDDSARDCITTVTTVFRIVCAPLDRTFSESRELSRHFDQICVERKCNISLPKMYITVITNNLLLLNYFYFFFVSISFLEKIQTNNSLISFNSLTFDMTFNMNYFDNLMSYIREYKIYL